MFSSFDEESRKVMILASEEMKKLKHPFIGSEHLLLGILRQKNEISERLKDFDLTYDKLFSEIVNVIGYGKECSKWKLYTPLLKRVIENAMIDSKENNNGEVSVYHLFTSILEEGEGVAIRILLGMNIDIDQLYQEFSFRLINTKKRKSNKKLLIEEMGVDLTKKAFDNELDPVIGRDNEIKRVLEILSRRTKNNPILIGEAGVGKTAIVEELARMISSNEAPLFLKNKRIISLDMATCVAGTKYRGEFEERISKILKELEECDDIILFIDEIHTLVGAGGAEGAIDASNIFKPALARNKLRCIGATTVDEYKKYIEKDSALERRFQKVIVEVPSNENMKLILENLRPIYEKFHHVSISDQVLNNILDFSNKYIYDRNQPDASIDILDEVCAKARLKENKICNMYNDLKGKYKKVLENKNKCIKENNYKEASLYKDEENKIMEKINEIELNLYKENKVEVTLDDLAHVISSKTKIPIYEVLNDKKSISIIEGNLKKKIHGQNNALKQIINIAKKIKLGYKENKCYSFMFTGSTGVGKTSLAKIFGESLYGKGKVIKLDMSEYSDSSSISKLIGSNPGYVGYDENNILEEVRQNPHSILILDEIDKASHSVIDLFYQILDEGKIKNSKGKEIRFDNTIIIMTSNVGYNDIHVGFNHENNILNNKLNEYFGTPFINRIDNIIYFDKLKEKDILNIIQNKLNDLKIKYKNKNIDININKDILQEILKLSNYNEYGARRIDKIIHDKIEGYIIDNILSKNNNINIDSSLFIVPV